MTAHATPAKPPVLLLWGIVALMPLVAGAVLGTIHAGYSCNIEDDDTILKLLGVEFIVLPIAAATAGIVAGIETLRPRGRVWAAAGALAGGCLSLVWGGTAFWMTLLTITDTTCG